MTMQHAERDHALLSASGAERWLVCTPSPRLEELMPEESSTYADEGTKAHELAEYRLAQRLGHPVSEDRLKEIQSSEYYNADMEDFIEDYCDTIMEKYLAAKAEDPTAQILLERRLNFSQWVPEGFGTGDVVIINSKRVSVNDLKYGKGVPVSAEHNPQMMLYGLGAWFEYSPLYDFDTVDVCILQPRLDSVSEWSISVEELLRWADREVTHRAALAWAGEGDFCPGDHCRFCKVAVNCRAKAEQSLALARYEFRMPPLLSHEEIGEILGQVDHLVRWATSIKEYAEEQAVKNGVHFPGWKVVEGRSNRTFTDPVAVQTTLDIEGYALDEIAPRKLLGITAMETLIGKKLLGNILKDLITKPEGRPTLAPITDKRPEWHSAAAEFSSLE